MRYNNYHKHTHYSNIKTLDCISKPEDYIKRAVELGHTTYFTTEHGFQGNIYEAHTLCEQYNLRCIYGVEAYYVNDMHDKSSRSNYHLMLVAMNDNGRKEINKIMSLANTDGFYYKPRINHDLIKEHSEGLICLSACLGGEVNAFVTQDKIEEAKRLALKILPKDISNPDRPYGPEAEKALRITSDWAKKAINTTSLVVFV